MTSSTFATTFSQVIDRVSTEYESWKQAFTNIRNARLSSHSIQIPFLFDMEPLSGQFEFFIYPSQYSIFFTGWNPVIISKGIFTIVVGLPSKPRQDIIVTSLHIDESNPRQFTVLAESFPDWQQILDSLTNVYPGE